MTNLKQNLREELLINDRLNLLSEHSIKLINSKEHVEIVLGIQTPINESYSITTRNQIINEQLLFEDIIQSIKGFLKDKYKSVVKTVSTISDVIVIIKDIITDPKKLQTATTIIGKYLNSEIKSLNTSMSTIMSKIPGLTAISDKLTEMLSKLKGYVDKLVGSSGWKGFILKSSFLLLLRFVKKTYIDPIINNAKELAAGTFLTNIADKLNVFKDINNIIPSLSDIVPIVNWFKKIGASTELLDGVFTPVANKIEIADNLFKKD
jgi:hypothetical protein